MKTIDPSLTSYKDGKGTAKIIEYLDDLDRKITVGDELATKILDIRIPKGTENYLKREQIEEYAAKIGINVYKGV